MTTATRKAAARKAAKKPASRASKVKRIYFFGAGKAEGRAEQKPLLGGKGANLHDMTSIGLPVPPGFTITTETCAEYYQDGGKLPAGLMDELASNLRRLEKATGKTFGDPDNPLLVSVRSGAAVSMPGMMDTVLNLGLNDLVTEGLARLTNNPRFAYDSYRRLINMFGDVVMGIDHAEFEHELSAVKDARGVQNDTDLTADDLKEVVQRYKAVYKSNL
ncbi:MAG TPA: PEP/pyruvate-binding domain-containing protein, partial [Tepidisphaeraceae bacterium]|nr:PEP/pyruvate-binding domain-containing protein [Tepidisphaeraceae bacterium]